MVSKLQFSLLPAFFLAGCMSDRPFGLHHDRYEVTVGWIVTKGEVVLFKSKLDLQHRNLGNCVSGMPVDGDLEKTSRFDGMKVRVVGRWISVSSLPVMNEPGIQRKMLNGRAMEIFCRSPYVISVTQIHRDD